MRATLSLILTFAVAAALCIVPVPGNLSPHTRVSANPEDLIAHQDAADDSIKINKHFVNNHEEKDNYFVRVVDGKSVEDDAFTKEQ
ncbi:MAG: hypothetical protein EXX96DRAFT_589725 [Benjaminiella poitrasii]|nr:MAG: hypothetical protein EXX96DRAFT_589725 [Benjaminiella poitrasii]